MPAPWRRAPAAGRSASSAASPLLGVAEAIVGGGRNSFSDEGAVRPVDSLRDRDQALVLRLIDLVDIRQKAFHVKSTSGR